MKKITLLAAVLVAGPLLGLRAQTPNQPKVAPGPERAGLGGRFARAVRALDVRRPLEPRQRRRRWPRRACFARLGPARSNSRR